MDECPKVYSAAELEEVREKRYRMKVKLGGWKVMPFGFLLAFIVFHFMLFAVMTKEAPDHLYIPKATALISALAIVVLSIRGKRFRNKAKNLSKGDLMIYKEYNAFCVIDKFHDYEFGLPRFWVKINSDKSTRVSLNKLRPATDQERMVYIAHGPQIE